ncbi:MAG: hypothetical protein ABI652_00955 [Acidobacteriota bacterium]
MDFLPSDFTSPDPYRGWWNYIELPVRNVCATQGAGLLRQVQESLHLAPSPSWTVEMQQALIDRAVELSATQPGWDGVISRLRSDLASAVPGTVVGPLSHQFAIYVAYYAPNNRRFDAISLPANVTLLRWNVPPASDGGLNGGAVVCVDPDRDSPFLNVTEATVSESATGIRVGPDRPVPPDQVTRPNAAVIGGGAFAAIVVVGVVGWWWFTRPRTNPYTATRSWHDAISRPRANPSMSAAQIEEWRACRARAAACEESILRGAKPDE